MNVSELQAVVSSALHHLTDEQYSLLDQLRQTYGDDAALLRSKLVGLSTLCDLFQQLYGDGPVTLLRAPARINILGEHVDYVSYLPTASLPFGSREHDMVMLFRASDQGRVRGASTRAAYAQFDFKLSEGPSISERAWTEDDWLAYLYGRPAPAPHWGNYVKGAAFFARQKYGKQASRGFDFVIDSSIPPNSGASSSSALVVLAGAAIRQANHIEEEPDELARDSAQAEWYVGTRGGMLDHIAICLARRQRVVHLSYGEEMVELVPMPTDRVRWVTFFSHPADKGRAVMLEYNERAAVSRVLIPAIVADLSRNRPDFAHAWDTAIQSFRAGSLGAFDELEPLLDELPSTVTLGEVEHRYPEAFRECQAAFPTLVQERREHPLKLRDRALHHLGEAQRVAVAVQSLRGSFRDGLPDKAELVHLTMRVQGGLLNWSHESLRDLYEVSTPEVDRLVAVINSDPHVYGARLMGGGFGGNVLALIATERAPRLIARVQSEYYDPQGRDGLQEGSVMVSTPGEGLSTIEL